MNPTPYNERDLLKQHAPLVASAVRQFAAAASQTLSAEHLHNLGLIALLDAARNYPPASGVTFENFARVQIQTKLLGEMNRAKTWFNGDRAAAAQSTTFA